METTRDEGGANTLGKDHLHIRGEHKSEDLATTSVVGSPPHTWRTPNANLTANLDDRITSTYVENTV